jgi:hypothetical protein
MCEFFVAIFNLTSPMPHNCPHFQQIVLGNYVGIFWMISTGDAKIRKNASMLLAFNWRQEF